MAKPIINDLFKIFRSSIVAVQPENLINNALRYNPNSKVLTIQGDNYNLEKKNVYVVGSGKAVQRMAMRTEAILEGKIKEGIISIPSNSLEKLSTALSNLKYFEGAKNNLPDIEAETTARAVHALADKLTTNDLLIVLISGGGSALLPLPKTSIKLEEKSTLIKKLANAGADITELNTVRKKISAIKGGKLALTAQPAQVLSLVLSDIVGDPLDLIASGPTTKNLDHYLKAKEIVQKYRLYDELEENIKNVLNEKKKQDPWPESNVKNYIIGSNKQSIAGAVEEAHNYGYLPVSLSNTVIGNVRDIAQKYVELTKSICYIKSGKLSIGDGLSQMKALRIPGLDHDAIKTEILEDSRSIILIFGGETTVEVKGAGKGGRNQQLALEFSINLHEKKSDFEGFDIVLLSGGTDGIDGPTDSAGAIGYLDLVEDAINDKVDINKYLNNNDSYNFYKLFKNGLYHLMTGHTGTNVMDIQLIMISDNRKTNS